MAREEHWDQVYASKRSTEVGWFQREPRTSLRLIERFATPSASVIDVGGGTSSLVDRLLVAGFDDVTLLDVSQHALTEVGERLGDDAHRVTFLHQDLLTWMPDRRFDVWHDRAVFHLLTQTADRNNSVERVEHAGRFVNERRVWRLGRDQGIWSTTIRKRPARVGQAAGAGGARRFRAARLHRADAPLHALRHGRLSMPR